MQQHLSATIGLALQAVMQLQRQTGALQATVTSHERRLREMEKQARKAEAPSWIKQLPISEVVLLVSLLVSGVALHLLPPDWRADLRAIITARANK